MRKLAFASFFLATTLLVSPAGAQELEDYFNACINGAGQIPDEEVVAACTYLIDNAQAENETVGMFYGMRGSINTDQELNCADGLKARELISDPGLTDAINQIVENNC